VKKICPVEGCGKPLRKDNKNGFCREHRRLSLVYQARQQVYKENNQEKMREYRHDYYVENKEHVLAVNAEWRVRNPEKTKEYARRGREKKPKQPKKERPKVYCTVPGCEALQTAKGLCPKHYEAERRRQGKDIDRQRAWRKANPEKSLASTMKWRAKNPEKVKAAEAARYAKDPTKNKNKVYAWREKKPQQYLLHCLKAQGKRRNNKKDVPATGLEAAIASGVREASCAACGVSGPCEIDHVIPLSWAEDCPAVQEALGQVWCYQPLCRTCNAAKRDFRIEAYLPTGDIGKEA